MRLVDGPHVMRKEIQPLDPDQARQLLAAIRGDRLEAPYTVALALGLRRGEALGLKWDDVDFATSTLYVQRCSARFNEATAAWNWWTSRQRRAVVRSRCRSSRFVRFKSIAKRQDVERLTVTMANLWTETGLVFTNLTGGPMDPETATKSFQRILKREGLPHQRFRDLCHACASLLLAQGLDLKVIQDILGHSTITITADLYAHVMMGAKRQAAAQMDAMLGSADRDATLTVGRLAEIRS